MKGSDEPGLIHPFLVFWRGTWKRSLRMPWTSGMNNTACLPLHRPRGCTLRRWPGHRAASPEWPGQRDEPEGRAESVSPQPSPCPLPAGLCQVAMVTSCPSVCQGSIRADRWQVQIRVSKQGLLSRRLPPPSIASISPVPMPRGRGRLGEEGALSIFSSCTGTSRWTASKEADFQVQHRKV